MKKRSLILFWTALFALVVCLPGFGQFGDWSTKPLQSERDKSYDALHYLIKVRLDLERKAFEGATTVIAASLREGLTACVLDAEEFTVTSVLDADGRPLAYNQTAAELTVRLPRPYKFGEEFAFTCIYHGQDPKAGLKFVAESADNPRLVFSDSWPANVHHWFPCYDYPNDKATSEIVATVERGLKAAANGRLVSVVEDAAAGTTTYHWSQDQPHSTYLIFLAAAPYVVVRDSYKNLPISYWVYPGDEAKVGPTYGKTPKMVEFFNRTFGYDYPWRKYDQVSVPSGGGAESTSATAMTQRIMVDERAEPDFPAIGIVSHELAHQWWGDLITLRSWAHTWLNESFATYSDYLYHRYEMGEDEGALNLRGKLEAYLREARTRYIRPIVTDRYEKPGDMFDAHTYPKGALVLHMLRSLLGDEPFFRTLSHFLHSHAFDVVDTADFIRSVKTVTGRNLDWFFDQWLFKPGHPVFEVGYEWDPAARVVRLRVAQVQDLSKGVPLFRVPVSVRLVTARGTETREIWVEKREETFELPLSERPLLVRFDGDNVLLKEFSFPKGIDELLFQLKHDDAVGRMDAAAALAAFGGDTRTAAALTSSLRNDPFWAVRKSALEALAKIGPRDGAAVFKTACRDSSSQVRAAALAALGDLKDHAHLEFYKDMFRKDPSYRVQAEALTAIGKTGDSSALTFLKQAAAVPSYRNMVARAAEKALALIDKK
jgi:aminopeptidase N